MPVEVRDFIFFCHHFWLLVTTRFWILETEKVCPTWIVMSLHTLKTARVCLLALGSIVNFFRLDTWKCWSNSKIGHLDFGTLGTIRRSTWDPRHIAKVHRFGTWDPEIILKVDVRDSLNEIFGHCTWWIRALARLGEFLGRRRRRRRRHLFEEDKNK